MHLSQIKIQWTTFDVRTDFLLVCILKKEDTLNSFSYLYWCSFIRTNLCQIKDWGLCNYPLTKRWRQNQKVKIEVVSSPMCCHCTSCMPAQLVLVKGWRNSGALCPASYDPCYWRTPHLWCTHKTIQTRSPSAHLLLTFRSPTAPLPLTFCSPFVPFLPHLRSSSASFRSPSFPLPQPNPLKKL